LKGRPIDGENGDGNRVEVQRVVLLIFSKEGGKSYGGDNHSL
jgi:hypothetical protein